MVPVRAIVLAALAACGFHHGNAPDIVTIDSPEGVQPDSRARAIDAAVLPDAPPDARPDAPPDAFVPPPPVVGYVQGTSGHHTGSTDTFGLAYTSAETASNLNVVAVTWGASASVSTITDTAGNTYAQVGGTSSGGGLSEAVYYAPNIAASASNTITVTFNASASNPSLRIAEYSGIVTASPVEHMTEAQGGTSQTISLTLLATSNAPDLLVAVDTVQASTDLYDANFTLRLDEGGDLLIDRVVNAGGTYSFTMHQTTATTWLGQIVAFKGK
jgi:hypothetical protein